MSADKKPVYSTLQKLLKVQGHCTLEDITAYCSEEAPRVLDVLHQNEHLLRRSDDDSSLIVGDKCGVKFEHKIKLEIAKTKGIKYNVFRRLPHFNVLNETTQRFLGRLILFSKGSFKSPTPLDPQLLEECPNENTSNIISDLFRRESCCVARDTPYTINKLEELGYFSEGAFERQIRKDLGLYVPEDLWVE